MKIAEQLIKSELSAFENNFRNAVKSNVPLLNTIMHYIVKRKGKQLRPMFVMLSAKLFGEINETTYRAASLVEILHTATLIHDDVVDGSQERRGFFSIYTIWKTKAAVLIGDYLLAKGLLLSLDNKDYQLLHILADAIKQMSEGELLQLEKSRNLNLNEAVYFEIVKNKTASLLASACAAGAWSTTKDETITEKMKLFGEKVGLAFQIKDDLFDYIGNNIGKPIGNDIKEKKITLPLLYTLNKVDANKKRELIYILKNKNHSKEKIKLIIDTVHKEGGIDYTINKMETLKNEALNILYEFNDCEEKRALEELVNYVTERKY